MARKTTRRLALLDDLLDYALRSECRFFAWKGSRAPIRYGITCTRCACINRAIRMGLVAVVGSTYVRTRADGSSVVIGEGALEQRSAITGEII